MSPQVIQPGDGDIFRDAPSHQVYTREHWADDWVEVEHLYCDWCYFGSGGEISSAQFSWRYGEGMHPGEKEFETVDRQTDLLNKYVLVTIFQGFGVDPILWHGIITDLGDDRAGAYYRRAEGQPDAPLARVPIGDQRLVAYGLELHLQRKCMTRCFVAEQGDEHASYVIRRALTFNEENAFANTGNRTLAKNTGASYIFARNLTRAAYWSSLDIVEYFFVFHLGRFSDAVPWRLSARAKMCIPDWDRPRIAIEGQNLFEIFNQLFDRSRLLSWQVRPVYKAFPDLIECMELDVFSFNAQPLGLPCGGVQAANWTQSSLDFDRAVDIQSAVLKDSVIHQVDQVVVRGARQRVVFSLSKLDGTLEGDWTAADEAAYIAGPNVAAVPNVSEKQSRLLDYRRSDRFERVYSYFRLPADWNYKVGNGIGGDKNYIFVEGDGLVEFKRLYLPSARFCRFLPRRIWSNGPGSPDDSPDVEMEPIGLLKMEADDTGVDRFQNIEGLAVSWGAEGRGEDAGRTWGASLKIRQDVPGVILKVSGAQSCQHFIAATDFTKTLDYDYDAQLDWQDNLIVTVMMELDERVEVRHPTEAVLEGMEVPPDSPNILYIDAGDRARLDYVVKGTVLGQLDGVLEHVTASYYCADDREWMKDVARLIYEWYGTKRQAFTLVYQQVNALLTVGELITTIGDEETEEEVNSVVTGINYDLLASTTEITTSFAELDALQF